jgi:hypothetical protein
MQEPTEIETRCKRLPRDWPWGAVYKAQVDVVGMYVCSKVLLCPLYSECSSGLPGASIKISARANANANAAL